MCVHKETECNLNAGLFICYQDSFSNSRKFSWSFVVCTQFPGFPGQIISQFPGFPGRVVRTLSVISDRVKC